MPRACTPSRRQSVACLPRSAACPAHAPTTGPCSDGAPHVLHMQPARRARPAGGGPDSAAPLPCACFTAHGLRWAPGEPIAGFYRALRVRLTLYTDMGADRRGRARAPPQLPCRGRLRGVSGAGALGGCRCAGMRLLGRGSRPGA